MGGCGWPGGCVGVWMGGWVWRGSVVVLVVVVLAMVVLAMVVLMVVMLVVVLVVVMVVVLWWC